MSTYDVIYLLKPVKEVEPGWYKLKWRPIWRHTFSVYVGSTSFAKRFGVFYYNSDARNGWNRSFKCRNLIFYFWKWELYFWLRWNFIVHKDGPSDVAVLKPLDLSGIK